MREDMQQRAPGLDSNLGQLRQGTTASVHGTPAQPVELYGTPVSMLDVKAPDSIIRKRLNKYVLYERGAGESFFVKNMATWLRVVTLYLNKTQDFWKNVLRTDKTKMEMFGENNTNTSYQLSSTVVEG